MSPQISFIWITIVAILYIVAWWLLSKLAQEFGPGRWRWFVIAPIAAGVLAAPWVDELWISWRFGELCKDAGVHVLRKVEVDGYLDDTFNAHREPPSAQAIEEFEKRGYQFYEMRSGDKYVVRKKSVAEWKTLILDRPTARYHYRQVRDNADAGYQLEATEQVVFDTQANEVIGRRVIYKRYPGWVNRLWIQYLGSGMVMCPDPQLRQPFFPEAVLTPVRAK